MIKLKKGDVIIIRRRVVDEDGFNVWTDVEKTEVITDFASVKLTVDGTKVHKGVISKEGFYLFPKGHRCPLCENGTLKYIFYSDDKYKRDYSDHKSSGRDDED